MKAVRSSNYDIDPLTGVQDWQAFKRSFLEYAVRFQFVRAALVDLHEPDWNGRYHDCLNSLTKLQSPKEAEIAPGEEASAVSAASTSASASSAPPAKNTRKAKAKGRRIHEAANSEESDGKSFKRTSGF
jgi:hypothetical protein